MKVSHACQQQVTFPMLPHSEINPYNVTGSSYITTSKFEVTTASPLNFRADAFRKFTMLTIRVSENGELIHTETYMPDTQLPYIIINYEW
jgi:hypothetical protein